MCGIFGYVGKGQKDVESTIIVGLERLEYRGYDSAGIAIIDDNGNFIIVKRKGRISDLKKALENYTIPPSKIGIGHTRWATHGKVSDENAHPHLDSNNKIAVVHNGIMII